MKNTVFFLLVLIFAGQYTNAQTESDFTIINQVKTTPVKDQQLTGTCWSFATTSFLETEALRIKKKAFNLSPLFFVYYTYIDKGNDYVRHHGNFNFAEGGQAHDVMNVLKKHGVMPLSDYAGKKYELDYLDHSLMDKNLHSVVKNTVDGFKEVLSPTWIVSFKGILDAHMGVPPEKVVYKKKTYSSTDFSKNVVGINPDDYIEITSYTHHPYYEFIDLELPDNWSHDKYFNVPIDELMHIMNNALEKGYSFVWDGDVSEKKWNNKKATAKLRKIDKQRIEKSDVQTYRQKTFDNYTTTDDHLMHITGKAKNAKGKIFYLTKNSWGDYSKYKGYLYMSEDYVKIKTVAILVHKDAIPKSIMKKMNKK